MSDKIRWRDAKALREENERLRDGLRAVMVGCEILGDPFDPQHIAEMVLEKGHHAKPTKEASSASGEAGE